MYFSVVPSVPLIRKSYWSKPLKVISYPPVIPLSINLYYLGTLIRNTVFHCISGSFDWLLNSARWLVDDTNLGCIDIIELMISLNSYGLRINDYDVASSLNFLLISFISTSKSSVYKCNQIAAISTGLPVDVTQIIWLATSMLVTDVRDEMCWRQLWDVGHLHLKDVTNIEILSLTSKNCHQSEVTNIHLSPTSI